MRLHAAGQVLLKLALADRRLGERAGALLVDDDVAQRHVAAAQRRHLRVEVVGGRRAVEQLAEAATQRARLRRGLGQRVGGGWRGQRQGGDSPHRLVMARGRHDRAARPARDRQQGGDREPASHRSSRSSVR